MIEWNLIRDVGYPEDNEGLLLILKRGIIMTAYYCNVSKQWMNQDGTPFYTQWSVTHWAHVNLPSEEETPQCLI